LHPIPLDDARQTATDDIGRAQKRDRGLCFRREGPPLFQFPEDARVTALCHANEHAPT
jgi:hypothetical protein